MRHAVPENASFDPFCNWLIIRGNMEIDDARLKKLIIQTFDTFKAFETELLAYEATFRTMKATIAEMGIATDLPSGSCLSHFSLDSRYSFLRC
jgi:hypothetical protein